MLKKSYYLSFYLIIIITLTCCNSYELIYNGKQENGWTHIVDENGSHEYTFTCPEGFEREHPSMSWQMAGISDLGLKSLTIKNCDLKLTMTPKYENFWLRRLIVSNVSELQLISSSLFPWVTYGLGYSSLTIEGIGRIVKLDKLAITGSYDEFIIRNCEIEEMDWNSIMMTKSRSFEFSYNRVHHAKPMSFNFDDVQNVTFINNEFESLGDKFLSFTGTNYQNLDFRFESNKIQKSNGSSMDFDLEHLSGTEMISIRNNTFNCFHSQWIKSRNGQMNRDEISRSDVFEDKYVLKYDDNVCDDLRPITTDRLFEKIKPNLGEDLSLHSTQSEDSDYTYHVTSSELIRVSSDASLLWNKFYMLPVVTSLLSFVIL